MDLLLDETEAAILAAVDNLARRFAAPSLHEARFTLEDRQLEEEIVASGFLDVGIDADLALHTAALVVERLARLPQAFEFGARMFVRPLLGERSPRPLCLVSGRAGRPIRFLRPGATVLFIDGDTVSMLQATEDLIEPLPMALFAYPLASLKGTWRESLEELPSIRAGDVLNRWRVALACEVAGLLAAALQSVVDHVSARQQFGRPLATFQALRHRLAEAQVRSVGVYWLAMKAAATLAPADTALAALHAQEAIAETVYDFHQFLGAMGMTLEHPLHLWTYRLKFLASELGGRGRQARDAADALWTF